MIIIMKPQATEEQIGSLCQDLSRHGMQVQRNAGVDCTVLGVLGDVAKLDPHDFLIQPGVERVMPDHVVLRRKGDSLPIALPLTTLPGVTAPDGHQPPARPPEAAPRPSENGARSVEKSDKT